MASEAEILEQLERGDDGILSPSLRPVLRHLRVLGFRVVDVHLDAEGENRFELIVDRPISRETAEKVSLPWGVDLYEDFDQHESFVGMGFLCLESFQCINGKWPD